MMYEFSVPLFMGMQDDKPVIRYYRVRKIAETRKLAQIVHAGADAQFMFLDKVVYVTAGRRKSQIEDVMVYASALRVTDELEGNTDVLMISSYTSQHLAKVLNFFGIITRQQQRDHVKYSNSQISVERRAAEIREQQDEFRSLLFMLGVDEAKRLLSEFEQRQQALKNTSLDVEYEDS